MPAHSDHPAFVALSPIGARSVAPGVGWVGWSLAFGTSLLLLVLATLPPWVDEPVRTVLMSVFAGLCHQIPERSFHVDGVSLAVCHRCFGIYAGLPLAALVWLAVRRWDAWIEQSARYLMPLAVAVPGVDWIAGLAGWWSGTPLSRLITGGFFGLAAGVLLVRALAGAFSRRPALQESSSLEIGSL